MEIKTTKEIIECDRCGNASVTFHYKKCIFYCEQCLKIQDNQNIKWIRVDDIIKLLESHRNCTKYHKVTDKLNSSQYYLKACLLCVLDEISQSNLFGEYISKDRNDKLLSTDEVRKSTATLENVKSVLNTFNCSCECGCSNQVNKCGEECIYCWECHK